MSSYTKKWFNNNAGGRRISNVGNYGISPFDCPFAEKNQMVIYGLGIFGLVVRYTTTVVWSVKSGMLNETFWGYQNFPSVFWAAAVFVMIKYMPWEKIFSKDRTKKMISKIASLSFGIYLMHMIIYRTLALLTGIENSTYVWRFVMPWVIYGICALLTFLLKKIPVLKYIVP